MSKPLHELQFSAFSEAVQASGGLNRWPQLGAKEVQSYTVFLSGPAAEGLPRHLREQEFRDATLEALTEKLGLNPKSFHDNVRVAEIVATRHAYMTNVLENSFLGKPSAEVNKDYELLSEFLKHPLIRQQVAEQQELSSALTPAIAAARAKLGIDVSERAAGGVSRGEIVARNEQFTVQDIGGGQVVAHENRRLNEQPEVGEDVLVSYYKGKGQVVVMRGQEVSPPFIDPVSGDLAVVLSSPSRPEVQMVLFNSMAVVAEFAEVHKLGTAFIQKAMEERKSQPKPEIERSERRPAGPPFIDATTGSIALRYVEGGVPYTAVFHSAERFASVAKEFSATPIHVELARQAERDRTVDPATEDKLQLRRLVPEGTSMDSPNRERGRYAGAVLAVSKLHILQDAGRDTVIVHDKRDIDKIPMPGQRISVAYQSGRGAVDIRQADRNRGRD